MTYTQVTENTDGSKLRDDQGLNRDAVRVAIIKNVGLIALSDGCGLHYWSEIAANIAVNEFVTYVENNLKKPPYRLTSMQRLLMDTIIHVNNSIMSWENPKTKQRINVLEKGANATFVGIFIFPFSSESETNDNKNILDELKNETNDTSKENKINESKDELKWGCLCCSFGDSEVYSFKMNIPEMPPAPKVSTLGSFMLRRNSDSKSKPHSSKSSGNKAHKSIILKKKLTKSSISISSDSSNNQTESSNNPESEKPLNQSINSVKYESEIPLNQSNGSIIFEDTQSQKSNLNNDQSNDLKNKFTHIRDNLILNDNKFGEWIKVLGDSHNQFLPFQGLKDKHIQCIFFPISPGDIILAVSDGVSSSYSESTIQWPHIPLESYEIEDGLSFVCKSILDSTLRNHKNNNTPPDDVTLGAIKLTWLSSIKKSNSLQIAQLEDMTKFYFPNMEYERDYINELFL